MVETNEYLKWKQKQITEYRGFMESLVGGIDEFLYLLDLQDGRVWLYGGVEDIADLGDKLEDGSYNTEQFINMLHPKDKPFLAADVEALAKGEKLSHDLDYRVQLLDGSYMWVNCRGTVKQDYEGRPAFMMGRISHTSLRYHIDSLTGLFNQEQFEIDMKKGLEEPKGYVLTIGMDDMKTINTVQGRRVGDQLLRQLASALENASTEQKAYRLYGDTFAIPQNGGCAEDLANIFADVQKNLGDQATVSGGIVPLEMPDMDYGKLVQYSEFTLRKAKLSGKNVLVVFDMEEYMQEEASASLVDELKESIRNDCEGFFLVYQPQFYTSDYRLFGAEALLRYESPTRGRIFPDEFIPLLEKFDIIYPVGLWVIREALDRCAEWRKYYPGFRMSVNMSYMQLNCPGITVDVLRILRESGLPGNALTIEVTESMQLQKYDYFNSIFAVWNSNGITISVDDFGTGYSGLSYLKNLNIDEVKIDRCFVTDIQKSNYNYTLMRNMIQLAENAQIRVCCEGVEDVEGLRVLQELKPDLLQGYFFSKPCEMEQFENQFLKTDSPEYKDYTDKVQIAKEHSLVSFLNIQHREILHSLSMGLWMLRVANDAKTGELYMDENMRRLLGFPKGLSPAKYCAEWRRRIHPDDFERVHNSVEGAMHTGKVSRVNYRWNHPERGIISTELTTTWMKSLPGEYCLQGYCWDNSSVRSYCDDMPTSAIWNFFDNFSDIVYVSDMDTYEMIYLNKAGLKAYGFTNVSQIIGKKCYELLQGSSSPCAMCTNCRLREGEFVEWQYYNPIIKRNVYLKDTMLTDGNRRCRLELAMSGDRDSEKNIGMDELAQETFSIALQADTPEQSLDVMLEYLGHALHADRVYIFEQNYRGTHDNTYEWVADGVSRQIDNLKDLPHEIVAGWYQAFKKEDTVVIRDLETMKDSNPLMYEILKPQGIHSLVTGPLYDKGKIIGFYGVDNPPGEYLVSSSAIIKIMGQFTSMFLKVRNLVNELRRMSLRDQLTGIGNRYALTEQMNKLHDSQGLGLIFCDVTGLKRTNDTYGHKAGDALIVRGSETLVQSFSTENCFRWGGDELVALCVDCRSEDELQAKLDALRANMSSNKIEMAVGASWRSHGPFNIHEMLVEAEKKMYVDKRKYYSRAGIDRRSYID